MTVRWYERLLRRPSRMALRIYLIGLVQFVIVAAVIEIDHQSREATRRHALADQRRPSPSREGHARFVVEGLTRVIDEPQALQREADRVASAFVWSVDVRDADGRVLAHADPPDTGSRPPTRAVETSSLPVRMRDGREGRFEYTPRARGPGGPPGPGERPPGPPGPPPFKLVVAVILVVVGVSSWLTARSFARPLASLSNATRAFGEGELDARANMARADEIGDLAKAFDDMADRIAALLLAERELLANVSHELRTPLARIRVALDLASEADPAVAVESFAEIAQDLAELERIVDDVLASARLALDAGPQSGGAATLPVRAERVDPRALLERSIARFRSAHPERTLRIDLPETLAPIIADPVLVRRVVDNLLDNAHKYTERSDAPVTLEAREDTGAVVIDVCDEGIGIGAEDQARLFEPFFRVDRSRTRATGGLGLGLVLARRVAEAHGGKLTIESALGKGTRARVRLPIASCRD